MDRRRFVKNSAAGLVALTANLGNGNPLLLGSLASPQEIQMLPGTQPLTWEGDLSVKMMDGAHLYIERKIDESLRTRQKHWRRDMSSREAYEKSVEANRRRFMEKIGAVDARQPVVLERFAENSDLELVSETATYRVYQVRWSVWDDVHGEGLLLQPKRPPIAQVVALPDADETPEQLVGFAPGLERDTQFARRLAESGCLVLVPTLIDRKVRWPDSPDGERRTVHEITHREWIYRQAFQMGRHIIGYEVQKVLAAVDWFQKQAPEVPVGVAGYGEGGLIVFYAAAADTRIKAALVSGYFNSRQRVWSEPIYRNVWGLLEEFGDAELATLIAPRGLVVEFSRFPEVRGQKGDLATPEFQTVATEFDRIGTLLPSGFQPRELVRGPGAGPIGPGSRQALDAFLKLLRGGSSVHASGLPPVDGRKSFEPVTRQDRQLRELENRVQAMVRNSDHVRAEFFFDKFLPDFEEEPWSMELRFPRRPPEPFIKGAAWYRDYFWNEVIGKLAEPMLPPNPRIRKIYDRERWVGYDVVLDVWEGVFAWGILLVPKDLQPGQRRPVVVCQHGRSSLPKDTIEPGGTGESYYRCFAARLADRGFVTFAPHALYRGEDRYRWLSRKGNGIKASLFSFIIAQHDQMLRWLGTLPFVDPERIAFYGLSYGGEAAVRVPAILQNYCLSICSGDFNAWTQKVAATDYPNSFMSSVEWEMPYFNMGNTFDYAELAALIFPRPFMIERGHHDGVARDRWVAYEYAKVALLYDQLGFRDRTESEYYNGGHTINGEGTFKFLHKHLNWPNPQP
jgi:dienelactone hydrolase